MHSALATTASRALPICESVKGNSGIDQNGFYLPETLLEFVIRGPSDSSKNPLYFVHEIIQENTSLPSRAAGEPNLNLS